MLVVEQVTYLKDTKEVELDYFVSFVSFVVCFAFQYSCFLYNNLIIRRFVYSPICTYDAANTFKIALP